MEDFVARKREADAFCRARVAECDVVVGLIGHLYGSSPRRSKASYTKRELNAAEKAGIPQLLFLASDDIEQVPGLRESDELWQRQRDFRAKIVKGPIVAFFNTPDSLATKVIIALTNWLLEEATVSWDDRRLVEAQALLGSASAAKSYLKLIVKSYRYMDLKKIGVSDLLPLRVPLLETYVPGKVKADIPEEEIFGRKDFLKRTEITQLANMGQRTRKSQSILSLLRQNDGLIVLGEPGSGKSTLLKFIALTLATNQGKTLGLEGRLPVLLPLAAYANQLVERDMSLDDFMAYFCQQQTGIRQLDIELKQALRQGSVLLLLDGLDEVRDLSLLQTVVQKVHACYVEHRIVGNKFVITSRVLGYQEVRLQGDGLVECALIDFDEDDIEIFIEKWTAALEGPVGLDMSTLQREKSREREELLETVRRKPGARSLACKPLLLTILAVMKWQGVTLPERRVELYQIYVETLLRRWNPVGRFEAQPARVLDVIEALKVLSELALWMQENSSGIGLIKENVLRRELMRIFLKYGSDEPEQEASYFLEYVRDNPALLHNRGGQQFGFIHLTFMEYLAAVALAGKGQQGIDIVAMILAERAGDAAWHEVILLTIGYLGVVQNRDEAASAIVQEIVRHEPGLRGEALVLAGRAVADAGRFGVTAACRRDMVSVLRSTIRADKVKARSRTAAGEVLAAIGDPRPEAMTCEAMELCLVPAGSFQMGAKEVNSSVSQQLLAAHEVDLPYDFYIGRYPVTVNQFSLFLKDGNNQLGDPNSLRGVASAPVVFLNWREADNFCVWLTEKWKKSGVIEKDWVITLPSEEEWEKAARGGLQILSKPQIGRAGVARMAGDLKANPKLGRWYPWGAGPDSERANYRDTGVLTPSAVGCFPRGASTYGCEEMSGNVWEWTRSVETHYPYPAPGRKRNLRENLAADSPRIVRGGSFASDLMFIRCDSRIEVEPTDRLADIGFRVVLVPNKIYDRIRAHRRT